MHLPTARLPGRLDPVLVVRGCQVCVRACGEHVAGDARERADLVIGDDGPVILLCRQGDPAEFVEGEDVRAGNVPDAPQRRAGGDCGDRAGDVGGGDRLKAGRGQANGDVI